MNGFVWKKVFHKMWKTLWKVSHRMWEIWKKSCEIKEFTIRMLRVDNLSITVKKQGLAC